MSIVYKCKKCIKEYSTYKSLWRHDALKHKVTVVENVVPVVEDVVVNVVEKNDNKVCKKCNRVFCDRIYRWRHEQKCKIMDNKIEEINEIKNKVAELEEIIKTNKLSKTKNINNGSINNGSINNGSINNGSINNNNIINNITINALGRENIIEKLTEKEKFDLLTDILFKEIPHVELIRKIFNNDKFVEDRNTMITNLQTKTCLAYNDESKKFEAKNKSEHIDNVIYYRHKDIRNLYKEMYDNKKIKQNARKLIEDYIEQFDNLKNTESYKKNKEEIIYIIYNCKELMKKLKDDIEL